jgi:ribosomal protein L40E
MTDTTCPSCDAPAPARARACARCGYRFFEDGGPADHLPRPDRTTLTLGAAAAALVVAVIAAALLLTGGGGEDDTAGVAAAATPHLTVLSQDPLSRRGAERLLEERYLPIPDDDEADVTCSGRIPKPAHSVRRCQVRYPGGGTRRVVILTNGRGQEVLSKP